MCPFSQNPGCRIQRKGYFPKKPTRAARIQRYRCLTCRRSFSDQTGRLTYRQKLPHFTQPVFRILTAGVSQRKCAEFLGIHRDTVASMMLRLARFAEGQVTPTEAQAIARGQIAVFDEMETFEHTKMKPLSITVAVDEATRLIVATKVAVMPAKGLLAKRSRRKYGKRPDHRPKAIAAVLTSVGSKMPSIAVVKSDQNPMYPALVGHALPFREHKTYKGRRGCVVGQGELKSGGFDPLFSLNHSCAMIRDNLKRLSRRTWCTTKRPDRLQALLELYRVAHNCRILDRNRRAAIRSGPMA